MKTIKLVSALIAGFLLPSFAEASTGISYHGRLLLPSGEPVKTSTQFKIQIRTPGTENCLMYEETTTRDLSQSDGVFSITIGDGTGTRTDSMLWSLDKIFANRSKFTFTGDCAVGTEYTPNIADGRRLSVAFNDGSFAGWEELPLQQIGYSPISLEAVQVGGFKASHLLRVQDGAGNPQNVAALTPAYFAELVALAAGTSTTYLKAANDLTIPGKFTATEICIGSDCKTAWPAGGGGGSGTVTDVTSANAYLTVTNGTSTPQLTLNVGTTANTVAAGNDSRFTDSRAPSGTAGGDLGGTYPNPSVEKIQGNAVASGTIPGADVGKVYRWNGTALQASYLNFSDLKTVTGSSQLPAACAVNEKMQWSALTDAFTCQAIGINANQITAGTIDPARLPAISAAPGGNNENIQYNNSGALGGEDFFKYNTTYRTLVMGPAAVGGNDERILVSSPINTATIRMSNSTAGTAFNDGFVFRYEDNDMKIVNRESGYIGFHTSGYGLERMRILADGKVGIGTTTPSEMLEVAGKIKGTELCIGADCKAAWPTGGSATPAGGDGEIQFNNAGALGAASTLKFVAPGTLFIGQQPTGYSTDGSLYVYSSVARADIMLRSANTGNTATDGGTLAQVFGNMELVNYENGYLAFKTNNTERVRVLAGGNVGIGTTTPSEKLEVNGKVKATEFCIGADCKAAWPAGGGSGTVTDVTSTNAYLTVATGTSTPALTLNVGTGANTVAAGDDARFTDSRAPTGAAAGDLDGTYPNPTVAKIQGNAVASGAIPGADIGKVYRWNGTNLVPTFLNFGDLRTAAGAQQLTAACAANEKIQWSVITDAFTCQSIGSLDASTITAGTIDEARLPASVKVWQSASGDVYRATGNVGIGTASPAYPLDMGDITSAMRLPKGTTAQQPAAADGLIRYNTESHLPEYSDGTRWNTLSEAPFISETLTADKTLIKVDGYRNYLFSISANRNVYLPAGSTLPDGWWVEVGGSASSPSYQVRVNLTGGDTWGDGYSSAVNGVFNNEIMRYQWAGALNQWRAITVSGMLRAAPGRSMLIYGGYSKTNGQGISIVSGAAVEGAGGSVTINAGTGASAVSAAQNGGNITMNAGSSVNGGTPGNIILSPGYNGSTTYGNIVLGNTAVAVKVGVGISTPATSLHVYSSQPSSTAQPDRAGMIVEGEGTSYGGRIAARTFSSTEGPIVSGYRALNNKTAPTAVQSGKGLLSLIGYGYDGSNWSSNSSSPGITLETSEFWTGTDKGSRIVFNTTANGTTASNERMRIDQNGRVGIGTTTPGYLLDVSGTIGASAVEVTTGGFGSVYTATAAIASSRSSDVMMTVQNNATDGYSAISFLTALGGMKGVVGYGNSGTGAFANAMAVASMDNSTPIMFGISGIEIARFKSTNGYFGIGVSDPQARLHAYTSGAGAVAAFQNDTGTCTVTPNTSSLSCSSDIRLKKNIDSILGLDALNKVLNLQAKTYQWKNGDSGRHIGYIAQEVEQVVPELVIEGANGYKQVSYSGFVPLLSEAIKEVHHEQKRDIASVKAENESLQKQVDTLKKQNESLEARLQKLEALLQKK
ncbi:tail fiber domain-containing protein [Bdellovibrio sp. HCB2-146]|uniref:tail fiber domain-containing protein n=1 Tax=Bdellovibrio sp. HCB2-146 TaxID=3394362 RepID=UPI0039BC718E